MTVSPVRDPSSGVPMHEIERLRLSASVKGILHTGLEIAAHEEFRGLFGTGLLLVALDRVGSSSRTTTPKFAPREFAQRLNDLGGARLQRAFLTFLDENRGDSGKSQPADRRASENLLAVFNSAASLPSHDGILASRHLVVALLSDRASARPPNAWKLLKTAGIDRRKVLLELLTSLASGAPAGERSAWAALLADTVADESSERHRGPRRPAFGVDAPSGRAADDCLDLDATVNAMASLIASPQLEGNLSLGVFGNWGSGKSFFMRRLRGAIEDLAAHARKDAEGQPLAPPKSWPNILQAEFNAWHYVDCNLWASLVTHLLEELQRFRPAPVDGEKSPLQTALGNLKIAADSREDAARVESAALRARDHAQETLNEAAASVESIAAALAKQSAKSVWELASARLSCSDKELANQLEQVGVQVDQSNADLAALYAALKEVTSTSGRLNAVLSSAVRSTESWKLWTLAAIMIGPLLLLLLVSFSDGTPWLRSGAVWLAATISSAVVTLTRALTWLRVGIVEAQRLMVPLATSRRKIELALDQAEREKAAEMARLEKQLAVREATLAAARIDVAARETQLRAAVEAVGDVVSGRTITRFVEKRIASTDYQKHLGLIALIRADFEQLSKLVAAHNAQRLSMGEQNEELKRALLASRSSLTAEEIDGLFKNLGVNRIVLYIDDLDRCPTERVVEVLQAIHLLLAFPLFVVVVGVDARWVSHSLASEYPRLLRAGAKALEEERDGVSTADYLEKIFQIPFWVPPLSTAAAQMLIDKLEPVSHSLLRSQPVLPPDDRSGGPVHQEGGAPEGKQHISRGNGNTPSDDAMSSLVSLSPAPLAEPRPLVLSRPELRAMRELAPIIGRSPRATKRFVNSYRLLKAALTEEEVAELDSGETALGDVAAPMIMLAVVTGAPVLAQQFLFAPDRSASSPTQYLAALCNRLDETVYGSDTARRVREFCQSSADSWSGLTFEQMSRWSTRVSQFAFERFA